MYMYIYTNVYVYAQSATGGCAALYPLHPVPTAEAIGGGVLHRRCPLGVSCRGAGMGGICEHVQLRRKHVGVGQAAGLAASAIARLGPTRARSGSNTAGGPSTSPSAAPV